MGEKWIWIRLDEVENGRKLKELKDEKIGVDEEKGDKVDEGKEKKDKGK